jgi:hypothetical protein
MSARSVFDEGPRKKVFWSRMPTQSRDYEWELMPRGINQGVGAVGWNLNAEQMAKLDAASAVRSAYPYWHQEGFAECNPAPV